MGRRTQADDAERTSHHDRQKGGGAGRKEEKGRGSKVDRAVDRLVLRPIQQKKKKKKKTKKSKRKRLRFFLVVGGGKKERERGYIALIMEELQDRFLSLCQNHPEVCVRVVKHAFTDREMDDELGTALKLLLLCF